MKEHARIYYVDTNSRHTSPFGRVPVQPDRTIFVQPGDRQAQPMIIVSQETPFDRLTMGQVIEIVAQLFATSIPSRPVKPDKRARVSRKARVRHPRV